jgi:hypothetical protein
MKLMRHRPAFSIVVLAIACAAGCAKKPDDAVLVNQIRSQISSDTQLKDASLTVTSDKGVVTLSGTVGNDAARLDAYKIAAQTQGVAKVVDQMSVQAAPAPAPATGETETALNAQPQQKPDAGRVRQKGATKVNPAKDEKPEVTDPDIPPSSIPAPDLPTPAASLPSPASVLGTPPPPLPRDVLIPSNTTMSVLMIDSVDSSVNHAGEIFHASLDEPILIGNQIVVPKGADVYVRLTSATKAGKLRGKSELSLELVKLEFQGESYPLVSSTYSVSGKSQGKGTAEKAGAGAVIGTIVGAIAGRGAGAAVGAAVGAGAGTVYQTMTKGKQVKVPSETRLDFLLDQPVTVTVMPRPATEE